MKGMATWFARNGVAANLLMVLIVAAGLFTITTVRKEIFPELATDIISVTVPYPGATPEEVEEGVCVRIEEAIQGLDGVKKITANAAEGAGTILVEVLEGYNSRELLDDVKSRVDAIDTFPENIESPVIREVTARNQVLYVALSGEAPEATLKHMGEALRDELLSLPGVTVVELTNTRPYEISIEVSESTLRRYGLRFQDVADAVRMSSLDLPGGSVKTEGGEILLRTKGQAYRGEDFERIPLISRADGSRIQVGDVATVIDGFADTEQAARFNGKPAVLVQVFRVGDQNVLELADTVKEHVAAMRTRMPEGIDLTIWQDNSVFLRQRMELLIRNGYTGLLLLFLVLALFLKLRLALWVSIGIPISFLGAIWLMPIFDVSVNMLSLFAFIVVLGIVVDDAIVVAESIHTEHENGVEGVEGAIRGTHKVLVPVIFAVLTTVAAFSPLLTVPGFAGKFWRVIPLIIIPTLLFSLVESLLVLPHHLSGEKIAEKKRRGFFAAWDRFQDFFSQGILWVARRLYLPVLRHSLRHRYITVALAIAVLVVTAGFVGAGHVKLVFMPNVEADYVVAMLTMRLGPRLRRPARRSSRLNPRPCNCASNSTRNTHLASPVPSSRCSPPSASSPSRSSRAGTTARPLPPHPGLTLVR
jgi:multidrug efflux pump subunit AcrB